MLPRKREDFLKEIKDLKKNLYDTPIPESENAISNLLLAEILLDIRDGFYEYPISDSAPDTTSN